MSLPAGERVLKLWLSWLPIVLLIAVALNQFRLVATESLSPWSGGGFGMFASTDSPGSRHLHVFVQNNDIRKEISFPRSLEDELLRAQTLPSHSRLAMIADAVTQLESSAPVVWDEIVVEVWLTNYQPDTLAPLAELLRRDCFDFPAL
jgi:hypothetical protein